MWVSTIRPLKPIHLALFTCPLVNCIVRSSCSTLSAILGPTYKQSAKESCLYSCGIIKLDTTEKPVDPPAAGSWPGLVAPPECRFSVSFTKVEQNYKCRSFHDGGTWGTSYEHEWCFFIRLLCWSLIGHNKRWCIRCVWYLNTWGQRSRITFAVECCELTDRESSSLTTSEEMLNLSGLFTSSIHPNPDLLWSEGHWVLLGW